MKVLKLFQCVDIREALLQVADVGNDAKKSSESKGLANNELGEHEFIVAIVIWYEVLYVVNTVSKHLQGLISFFKDYRENGFLEALQIAKAIALDMDIGMSFRKRRVIKRKRHFDENPDDTDNDTHSEEESFRITYFRSREACGMGQYTKFA